MKNWVVVPIGFHVISDTLQQQRDLWTVSKAWKFAVCLRIACENVWKVYDWIHKNNAKQTFETNVMPVACQVQLHLAHKAWVDQKRG